MPTRVELAGYSQIFSGLILSTQRIERPPPAPVAPGETVESSGYWVRTRMLVLRSWRGEPPTVAELWTPVVSDCDVPPIPGSYFVALVRAEAGRSIARHTYCNCARQVAERQGRGTFAVAGISIVAAAILAAAAALLWLVSVVRRRRPLRG